MSTPAPEADYHEVHFADTSQVAAFVAALSRALASPAGRGLRGAHPVECWSVDPGASRRDAAAL